MSNGPDKPTPGWSRLDQAQRHLFPAARDDVEFDAMLRSLSDQQLLGAIKVGQARAYVEACRAHHVRDEVLAEALADQARVEAAASLPVTDAVEGITP